MVAVIGAGVKNIFLKPYCLVCVLFKCWELNAIILLRISVLESYYGIKLQ